MLRATSRRTTTSIMNENVNMRTNMNVIFVIIIIIKVPAECKSHCGSVREWVRRAFLLNAPLIIMQFLWSNFSGVGNFKGREISKTRPREYLQDANGFDMRFHRPRSELSFIAWYHDAQRQNELCFYEIKWKSRASCGDCTRRRHCFWSREEGAGERERKRKLK